MYVIQACFDSPDSLYCFFDFWHYNLPKVILTEPAINGELIGTVHDLVEVAAMALRSLLEETQLFVVKSDFADVVSVGVVHLLKLLKLVVIGD